MRRRPRLSPLKYIKPVVCRLLQESPPPPPMATKMPMPTRVTGAAAGRRRRVAASRASTARRNTRHWRCRRCLTSGGATGGVEAGVAAGDTADADRARLHQLGYKQELKRGISLMSNFAFSFSIISVMAGMSTKLAGKKWAPLASWVTG